jgi:hypothetical protein
MTLSDGRSYVRETVAGVLHSAFRHEHAYRTSCTRKSLVRISCDVGFWSGPNDYWGTVTVYYVVGTNSSVEWTNTYRMHWVNDQCYFHSTHRSRCRITNRSGSW